MTQGRSRLAWLDAMGIEVWKARTPAPAEDAVETAAAGAGSIPVESKLTADIAHNASADAQEGAVDAAQAPAALVNSSTQVAGNDAEEATTPDIGSPVQEATTPAQPDVPQPRNADERSEADLSTLENLVAACQRCELSTSRTNTVFGSGNPEADWLFIGEAPGREEDRKGEAFVGAAGKLLDAMLLAMGLDRDEVFIANVLKCRPPNNRDPMGNEVTQCEPFLLRQVELVRPRMIVAMGRFAAQSMLKSTDAIGRLRGSAHSYADTGIPMIVTYHPAYLLRSPAQKGKVWENLLLAKKIMDNATSAA